jgi:putative endonuclease
MMDWYVYILECSDKSLYTGITNNIEKRIKTHNAGKGSKSLLGKLPVKLVYSEKADNRSEALKREAVIKN